MTLEHSTPNNSNSSTVDHHVNGNEILNDLPIIPLLGREVKLVQLHESYFQPFYQAAERCDFEGTRGVVLSARSWQHSNSHSTLLIVAGRNESHAKYAEVAYDFFTRGYDVWICDHRGQGFSQRELLNTQIGWVEHFQTYINDLSLFYERYVAKKQKRNLLVLAHSMGAAITSLWLSQSNVRPNGVVFTAPMIDLVLKPYPRFVVRAMVSAGLRTGRGESYIPGGTDFKAADYGFDLTNSTARRNWNRKLFSTYPEIRLGSPSFRWLSEALKVRKKIRSSGFPRSLTCPLMVWQAGADVVVKPNAHLYLRAGLDDCIIELERRSQHELLQERDEIRARVLSKTFSFFESASERGGSK